MKKFRSSFQRRIEKNRVTEWRFLWKNNDNEIITCNNVPNNNNNNV